MATHPGHCTIAGGTVALWLNGGEGMYEERWPWLDFTGLAFAASPIRRQSELTRAYAESTRGEGFAVDALETIGGLLALLFVLGCGYAAWEMFRSVVKPKPEDHLRW